MQNAELNPPQQRMSNMTQALPYGQSGGFQDDEGETAGFKIGLADLRSMAWRQRYLIGAVVLAALIIGAIITFMTTPIYQAAASVRIDQERAKIVEGQDVDPIAALSDSARYLQTQIDVLNSRAMAYRVTDALNLGKDDSFLNSMKVKPLNPALPAAEKARIRRMIAVGLLQGNAKAALPISTRIAQITFKSPDPVLAAKIANAYAENYLTANISSRFEATRYARSFLQGELERARERVQEAEQKSLNYAREAKLIDAGDAATSSGGDVGISQGKSGSRSLTTANAVKLNQDLVQARSARLAAEQKWAVVSRTPVMNLPQVKENGTIQSLIEERAKKNATLQELRERYKSAHPQVIQLTSELRALDRQIAELANQTRSSIRDEFVLAQKQEAALQAEVEGIKGDVLVEQQKRVQLDLLERDADTSHELYDSLLQRYKEVGAASGITTNNVSLLDKAEVPGRPIAPRPLINMTVAGLTGLALALLLAFMRETVDDTLRSPEDVERKLQVPLLGSTPVVTDGSTPLEAINDPKSSLSEAYYSIRAALDFTTSTGAPPTLLITSSRPAEGKSTTSVALARDFARIGRRTLLVDGDLRSPSLHKMFGLQNVKGFTDVMTGKMPITDAVQRIEGTTLDFLSLGPIPPNPAQLLSGNAVPDFIKQYTQMYDLILFDGPPVMGLADAPLMSRQIHGVIVVVEAERSHRGQAKAAFKRLKEAHANILGVVLSKFDERSVGYGYGYGYEYNYAYGQKRTRKDDE